MVKIIKYSGDRKKTTPTKEVLSKLQGTASENPRNR